MSRDRSEREGPAAQLRAIDAKARKSLGQHFLSSPSVARRIVQLAGVGQGTPVVEVGPGLGALTEHLRTAGARLVCVERDDRLADQLLERWPDLELLRADAMRVDWAAQLDGDGWSCVSNLPYNVGTHIVSRMVRTPGCFRQLVVMLQREVADRICAEPGSKIYGALSVELQARARCELLLRVKPGSFHPPPKVDSAVIRLEPRLHPAVEGLGLDKFDRVVRAAFNQRRKTLRKSLGGAYGKARALAALEAAGIESGLRPEVVPVEGFAALTRALSIRDEGAGLRSGGER
jgi:16S rRNA (adenine1518-N6/adenine1519-N6)-dimethyltransferase